MNKARFLMTTVVASAMLPGCVAYYQVVGRFDHYDGVFVGTVRHNLLTGSGHIIAATQDSQIICEGDSCVIGNLLRPTRKGTSHLHR